jgi:hydrogenase maturation protease
MMNPRILIACVGNIFLGDDGFGTEVALRLAASPLPPEVVLKDFGIRGLDLTYALLDPYDLIILVDACSRGGDPGTIYVIEPEPFVPTEPEVVCAPLEAHGMNPMNVLRMVNSMGVKLGRILLVGCEPAWTGSDEEGTLGLSAPVEAAVDEAVTAVRELVSRALEGKLAELVLQSQ